MVAAASDSETAGEELEVIQFTLSGTEYAIEVSEGNTIIEPKATTRVPRSADSVDGVMDYRGEVAVIIDLHAVLGVERDASEVDRHDDRIILLDEEVDNQTVGVRTDDVIGVRTFDTEHLRDNVEKVDDEEESTGVDKEFLNGVFTVTEEDDDGEEHIEDVVELVDTEAILADVRESSRLELQQTK